MDLRGTAVVTGAGSGIGRALARAFVDRGLSVAALDIDGDRAVQIGQSLPLAFPPEKAVIFDSSGAARHP